MSDDLETRPPWLTEPGLPASPVFSPLAAAVPAVAEASDAPANHDGDIESPLPPFRQEPSEDALEARLTALETLVQAVQTSGSAEREARDAALAGIRADVAALRGELGRYREEARIALGKLIEGAAYVARLQAEAERQRQRAEAAESRRACFESVWQTAPLALRLQFVRDMLPADHPYLAPLQEAANLLEVWRKGDGVEAWISGYPAVCAGSYAQLLKLEAAATEPELLARESLAAAREVLDANMAALGFEWVVPEPGTPVTSDYAVSGEAQAPGLPGGSVAAVDRPGLRFRGRLLLPAQVRRQAASAPQAGGAASVDPPDRPDPSDPSDTAAHATASQHPTPNAQRPTPNAQRPTPNTQHPTPNAQCPTPTWLPDLQRAALGESSPPLAEAMQALEALAGAQADAGDAQVQELLLPILPLLGPAAARTADLPERWREQFAAAKPALLAWLGESLQAEVWAPAARAPFDPASMEAASEWRTAHSHEDDTVARVERPGLRRAGRLLLPARVVRYSLGGSV